MKENNTSSPKLRAADIELRSEEVQEILTKVPNWMIRRGSVMILTIVLLLLLISWFVKYPDVVKSEIIITTIIPPEKIVAKTSGRIEHIFTQNKSFVTKESPLAIIENAANYKDVFRLKGNLEKLNTNKFPFEKFRNVKLGDIEPAFGEFKRNYIAQKLSNDLQPFAVEISANSRENKELRERLSILMDQQKISEQELELNQKEFERISKLFKNGAIAEQEFETKKIALLQSEKNYKNLLSAISSTRSSLIDNQKSSESNKINKEKDNTTLDNNTNLSLIQLKKAIKDWELNFLIKSSIAGNVSFSQVWVANQTVNAGDNVFSVVPTGENIFIGKIKAPANNLGKIKIDQTVNIRLLNYPDREFGILKGKVQNISLVPDKEGNVILDISLPNKLVSSYDKEIPFQQEMKGSADIITEDLRLIERFFYQFRSLYKE